MRRLAPLGLLVFATALSCSRSRAPAPPGKPVSIVVTNERATPVFVSGQSACFPTPARLESADGARVELAAQANDCEGMVRSGTCAQVGACGGPLVFLLEPGKSLSMPWDGMHLRWQTLSTGDVPKGCPTSCTSREGVPAGRYTVVVDAWSACPECSCNPGGPCARPPSLSTPPDVRAEATLDVPTAERIAVSIR
jgi:hypothetical protein